MRSIRRALTLVSVVAAAAAFVLVGGSSAGAARTGQDQPQSRTYAVTSYQADQVGQYDDVGIAIHTCYEYWIKSAHTTNYKWYHCHATQYSNRRGVHICGNSGYLHGITITIYSSGNWDADNHAHDYDGEGCA